MIETIAAVLDADPHSTENTPAVKALPSGYSGTVEQNYRVLLVEDNKVNQIVAIRMLRKIGINDVVMVDGYVATGKIRELGGYARDVPIIAVTADAMEGDRERCLEAGMSDYIAKPVTSAGLSEVLNRFLKNGESRLPQNAAADYRPDPATGSADIDEDDVA